VASVRFRRTPIRWALLPLVVAGGTIGVAGRALLTADLSDPILGLPVVFVVNALGSGLLGLLVGWAGDRPRLRAFLGTGVLGGFTSYSALAPVFALVAVDTAEAATRASALAAGTTLMLLVVGGVLLLVAVPAGIAAAGYALGRRIGGAA